jgi:protein required for attachment to host cells
MPKPTTWFVVADRSRVRVCTPDDDGTLRRIRDFDAPTVRARAQEVVTGRRGRRADGPAGTAGRSAMDPQTPAQDAEVARFVNDVSEWLEHSRHHEAFDELVLVAGPQMLGELRQSFPATLDRSVGDTLDRVYTPLPWPKLTTRLRKAFPNRVPQRPDQVPASARTGNQQPTR